MSKEYFTNFHSHRWGCECGDKDKFSMLPIGELRHLLDIQYINLHMKMYYVEQLHRRYPNLLVDPILVDDMLERFERPTLDWLSRILSSSKRLQEDLQKKNYKIVRSKVKKKKYKEDLDYYSVDDKSFNTFIEDLKKEGLIR